MTASIKIDRHTPLSVLKALALSLARDIDKGEDASGARVQLELVMALVPTAPKGKFA